MRRVRIRADDKLSRHRIAFEHDRVADSFRSFAVGQLAMQTNAFAFRKLCLFELELRSQVEQAHLAFLLGEDFIEKSQVVAKEKYRAGIIHRGFFADKLIEENRRHGRDVFVAKAQVGSSEARHPVATQIESCALPISSPPASSGAALSQWLAVKLSLACAQH